MFKVVVPGQEFYNERLQEFLYTKEYIFNIEHSLVSLSKWESEYMKPFVSDTPMTPDEFLYYIKCMTITQNVPDDAYRYLTQSNLDDIRSYMNKPMTATTISSNNKKGPSKIVTAELIYSWMIALNIPFECRKFHLNQLIMLINVCNEENQPKKKLSKKEAAAKTAETNRIRRAQHKNGR